MRIKPSYEIIDGVLIIYRARGVAIGTFLASLILLIWFIFLLAQKEDMELNVYTLTLIAVLALATIDGFLSLISKRTIIILSNNCIVHKSKTINWCEVTRINWEQTYEGEGSHHLNIKFWFHNTTLKPYEIRYQINPYLKTSFTKKIFEPFICNILKDNTNIKVGEDICLCNDYWVKGEVEKEGQLS